MAVDPKYALMLCALMAPTLVNSVFASDRDFARIQSEPHVRPEAKIRGCHRCEEWNEEIDKCYRHHGHIVFSTGQLLCEIPSQRSK